jgi:hypothetical protein
MHAHTDENAWRDGGGDYYGLMSPNKGLLCTHPHTSTHENVTFLHINFSTKKIWHLKRLRTLDSNDSLDHRIVLQKAQPPYPRRCPWSQPHFHLLGLLCRHDGFPPLKQLARLGWPAAPGAVAWAWSSEFDSWNWTRDLTEVVSTIMFFQCLGLVHVVIRSNLHVICKCVVVYVWYI